MKNYSPNQRRYQHRSWLKKPLFSAFICFYFVLSLLTPHALQAGCAPDCPQGPCFQPLCITDDHTPFAFDLCTIYEIARCHDAKLQAAKQEQLAAQETMPQASASFLPVISANAAHTNAYNNGGSFFSPEGTVNSKVGSYVSNIYTLALTQPVLHFEHWQKFEQACDIVKQANATFAAAEQDLMMRTAQGYFGVLDAIDKLYFALSQLKALKKFYDQTSERFKVGLIAITDVQIAKARHDNAVAQVIAARTLVSNQLDKLREIVGYRVEHLLPLKDELNLPPPEPSDPEQWVAVSLKQNFNLQAQRYKTLAAREDIKITETGHLPTIDLNGQLQRITPTNQVEFAATISQLTMQVNLPLFSGGSVISKTRQARHIFLQRDKETEALFRNVESNTRQFYLNVLTQISQVAAFKQAVVSNQAALDATQASFNVGTRTIVDVLNAQTDLIQAQLNVATARYAYIIQSFELKRSAGILSPMDLCSINAWLKSTAADAVIKEQDINAAMTLNTEKTTATHETPITVPADTTKGQENKDLSLEDKGNSLGASISQETVAGFNNTPNTTPSQNTDSSNTTNPSNTTDNLSSNTNSSKGNTSENTATTNAADTTNNATNAADATNATNVTTNVVATSESHDVTKVAADNASSKVPDDTKPPMPDRKDDIKPPSDTPPPPIKAQSN